jgi:hypothetical protein
MRSAAGTHTAAARLQTEGVYQIKEGNEMNNVRKPTQAHSKTEYKRLVTQGANVLPPNKGDGMKIELTPAVVACLKRGLNCWFEQNFADGAEIRKILEKAEEVKLRIGEDV